MKGICPRNGLLALAAAFGLTGIAHAASEFTVHNTGTFYHKLSDKASGFDLDADAGLMASDPDSLKDFLDNDAAGSFEGKWKAGNATAFVNAPGWPTFNAQTGSADFTFAKIDSLYKAGTVLTNSNSTGTGTGSHYVYIAKLRGGPNYVIVKFLANISNSNSIEGSYSFEYWKMPPANGGVTNLQATTLSRPDSRVRLGNTSGMLIVDRNGKLSGGLQIVNALGRPLPNQAVLFQNLPR